MGKYRSWSDIYASWREGARANLNEWKRNQVAERTYYSPNAPLSLYDNYVVNYEPSWYPRGISFEVPKPLMHNAAAIAKWWYGDANDATGYYGRNSYSSSVSNANMANTALSAHSTVMNRMRRRERSSVARSAPAPVMRGGQPVPGAG